MNILWNLECKIFLHFKADTGDFCIVGAGQVSSDYASLMGIPLSLHALRGNCGM
jgi:hypothetical protein